MDNVQYPHDAIRIARRGSQSASSRHSSHGPCVFRKEREIVDPLYSGKRDTSIPGQACRKRKSRRPGFNDSAGLSHNQARLQSGQDDQGGVEESLRHLRQSGQSLVTSRTLQTPRGPSRFLSWVTSILFWTANSCGPWTIPTPSGQACTPSPLLDHGSSDGKQFWAT